MECQGWLGTRGSTQMRRSRSWSLPFAIERLQTSVCAYIIAVFRYLTVRRLGRRSQWDQSWDGCEQDPSARSCSLLEGTGTCCACEGTRVQESQAQVDSR